MKETDIITITLKGQKAKEYFLEKITKSFGVRFKDIPKEPLVIEEKGSSKMVVEIFKDLLEMKILNEANFQFIECTEQPKNEKSKRNNSKTDIQPKISPRGLGQLQKDILNFMKKNKGEEFSLNQLACATSYSKSKLKTILESLFKRKLIKRKEDKTGYLYFYVEDTSIAANENVETNLQNQESDIQSDSSESTQQENTYEILKKEAFAKQTDTTKKILKLFVTSKYIHILNEIFKNDMFSVEAIRQKSDYADAKALTEVIGALDNEAIHYSQNEDGTYNVDNVWRTYALSRLGKKDIETEKSQNVIELLLNKGLIYQESEGKYNIMM